MSFEHVGTEVTVLPDVIKEGYTVTSWATEDVTVTGGKFTMPAKAVTFTATSTINSYAVTYKLDGEIYGTVTEYNYGTEVVVLEGAVKEGYTVTPWATEDVTVTGGKFTMPAKAVTFTATSTENEPIVVVNDDGTTTTTEETVYEKDGATITEYESKTVDADGKTVSTGTAVETKTVDTTGTVTKETEGKTVFTDKTTVLDYSKETESGSTTTKVAAGLSLPDGAVPSTENLSFTSVEVDKSTLSEEVREAIGDAPVFDLTLMSGTSAVTQFGKTVTVSIYYELAPGQKASNMVIYYISADGNVTSIDCTYDEKAKTASFETDHFSMYAVGFEEHVEEIWYISIAVAAMMILIAILVTAGIYRKTAC